MKVLVACEESQRVCIAFRERGHEAYSCDILECSGGHPEWHIQGDVLPIINGNCEFETADGQKHRIDGKWDLLIAHPPCTYLTVTGNRWFNVERYGDRAEKRIKDREEAAKFFMAFVNADCAHVAIENPVGYMSTYWRKPDQIIQPWMFGDAAEKKTCLWLKGLHYLMETNVVNPPERVKFDSGKSMPKWYADAWHLSKEERSRARSKTFPGIAKAMAEQWGDRMTLKENLEQTKWIPCSERQPQENGNYLAFYRTSDGTTSLEFMMVDHCNAGGGWLHEENGRKAYKKVIAWMPLPEPYKAESEDKE